MKRRDLFDDLSPAERETVQAKFSKQHFAKGSQLFSQNSPFTSAYLICSGVVRIYYVSPTGNEITTGFWSGGAIVGGPKLFREHSPHVWSAQAVTQVETQSVRTRDLEALAMEIPAVARYLIESLGIRLHLTSVLLQAFGTESVRSRLAQMLLHLTDRYGVPHDEGILITQKVSHNELARLVGSTRSYVSFTMTALHKQKVIAIRGRNIVIANPDELARMAHDTHRSRMGRKNSSATSPGPFDGS